MMPRLEAILAMPNLRRWHTRRTTREQNLAEHSGMVALLCLILAPANISLGEREQMLRLALVHDLHETTFGDMPFPAKEVMAESGMDLDGHCQDCFWGFDIWLGVSQRVKSLVHVADVLEAAVFARDNAPGLGKAVADQARLAADRAFPDPGFDRDWVLRKVEEVLA